MQLMANLTEQKMKATLTFDLPEDQYEYEYTLNAARYKDALRDIMQLMRQYDKHNNFDEPTAEAFYKLYDEMAHIVEGLELH